MTLPTIIQKAAALCLLLGSTAANATVLTFTMPTGYSLDSQPGCMLDAACLFQAGLPAALSLGLLSDQALMPAPANDLSHITSHFAANDAEDDVFLSLARKPAKTSPDTPADRHGSTTEGDDDLALMKKLSQGLRQTYSSIHALVALPDDYQGHARDAGNPPSVECHDGVNVGCDAGAFDPVMASLCASGNGNAVGATSKAACPTGSVYVGNMRGAGTAEYADYAQLLRNFAKDTASHYSLTSFDGHAPRNDASARQSRHCGDCDPELSHEYKPGMLRKVLLWLRDPLSILLLGLGLVAALCADALLRARRS